MKHVFKAFYTFFQLLLEGECAHSRVDKNKSGTYCPDCGYQVQVQWSVVRCRTCTSKRLPKQRLDGKVAPMFKYCNHCGGVDYQVIKKHSVNAHELPYALMVKEIDYSEHHRPQKEYVKPTVNPFASAIDGFHVVEGQVVHNHN